MFAFGGIADIGGQCPFLSLSRYSIELRTLHSVWSHLNQELCSNDVTLTPNNSVFSLCVGETKNECAVRKVRRSFDSHAAIGLLYDQAMLRCRSRFGRICPICRAGRRGVRRRSKAGGTTV